MTKDEFLAQLNQELATTGSYEFNREQIAYYRDYINGELAKGRTEQQVMDELGDPLLIAKTIKNANGLDDDRPVENDSRGYAGGGSYQSSREYSDSAYRSEGEYRNSGRSDADAGEADGEGQSTYDRSTNRMKGFKVTGGKAWLAILGICLVLILLIGVVFSALGGLFALSPMGWILILLVVMLFRNRY